MNRKILTISVAAHVAVAAGLGYIQVQNSHKATVIELADVKKPKAEEKKPPPEPPKPKAEPPKQQRPRAAARTTNAAQPTSAPRAMGGFEGVPDFGLALSGNGEGIAVAVAAPALQAPDPPKVKTLSAPAAPKLAAGCSSPLQKPVPINVPKPEYPASLRGPTGNGRVRVKLTIDEQGQVIAAEIISGMQDEFNQAALTAARRARFEPGTQCGNPVTASFTIAMRFSSG
jgi:periplasmic protein TonB